MTNSWKSRIAASVRTTNRLNLFLNDSQSNKKRAFVKPKSVDNEEEDGAIRSDIVFFKTNFTMEHVYKLIESIIDERLMWDRFSRMYDSWRSVQLAESLAADIRDRVKQLNHKRHRVVCILSLIEKQSQGVTMKMRYLMDSKLDNFASYNYERATYNIVATVFLVHKE